MRNTFRLFTAVIALACSYTQVSAQYRSFQDTANVKPGSLSVIIGTGLGTVATEFSLGFSFSVLYRSNEFELRFAHTLPDNAATSTSSGDILFSKNYTSTSFPTQQIDEITLLYGKIIRSSYASVTFSGGLSWASATFRGDHLYDDVTPITNWWTDAFGNKVASMDGGTDTKKYYKEIDITSIGYTTQMKLRFDLGKNINLGITGFATYHPEMTYYGALFTIDFGSFHTAS